MTGGLFKGACHSRTRERQPANIEQCILPALTVLTYDAGSAKVSGRIRAHLEETGTNLPDADLQIAATALGHALEPVTGNLRHFSGIGGLKLNTMLADPRQGQ